jgi:hypothetical protein
MAFTPELLVYVIRLRDGAVLHASYLDYQGNRRRFTEWAASNGRALRAEVKLAAQTFVDVLLEQYFAVTADRLHAPPAAE